MQVGIQHQLCLGLWDGGPPLISLDVPGGIELMERKTLALVVRV
jgi:hypothetical protein